MSGQFHSLRLYPGRKIPRYPLDRRLSGIQSWSGHCREEKKLTLPGMEPGPSAYNPSRCIKIVVIYCTIFGWHQLYNFRYLTTSDHQLYRVWVLETPFWLLIRFYSQSQPHVTTFTHNYLLRLCTFTQLQSLHANIPFYSLTVFITHLTSSHVCLLPRTHS
jgi:hypothetical protein